MAFTQQVSLAHLEGLQQAFDDLTKLVGPVMCGAEGISNDLFNEYIRILQRGNSHAAFIAALAGVIRDNTKFDIVQAA